MGQISGVSYSRMLFAQIDNTFRRYVIGPPRRGKVAMFHVGRCGSTVLAKILGQHSQLYWGNELFADINYREDLNIQPNKHWMQLVIEGATYRSKCDFFGFEIKVSHLDHLEVTVGGFVAVLREMGFGHFIILTRSNLLRVIISSIIGGQTKRWHVKATPEMPKAVNIDVNEPWGWWVGSGPILNLLESLDSYYANCFSALHGSNLLEVNYEQDIERDPSNGYHKICGFLGIKPEPFEVQLSRTNPFTIEQMVANYDEVCTALRGTRFEWMLTA